MLCKFVRRSDSARVSRLGGGSGCAGPHDTDVVVSESRTKTHVPRGVKRLLGLPIRTSVSGAVEADDPYNNGVTLNVPSLVMAHARERETRVARFEFALAAAA